jgi:hypothetical protein
VDVSKTEALTQEEEWNADRCHRYCEPFEEMMIWHISHSKDGLALCVSKVCCGCLRGVPSTKVPGNKKC